MAHTHASTPTLTALASQALPLGLRAARLYTFVSCAQSGASVSFSSYCGALTAVACCPRGLRADPGVLMACVEEEIRGRLPVPNITSPGSGIM